MKTVVGLALVAVAAAAETQSYWGDLPVDPTSKTTTTTTTEATWSDYDPAKSTTTTEATWSDYDPSTTTTTTTPVKETTVTWSGKCREISGDASTNKAQMLRSRPLRRPLSTPGRTSLSPRLSPSPATLLLRGLMSPSMRLP
jgi:hypothetical protein